MAERCREQIAGNAILVAEQGVQATASFGVAALPRQDVQRMDDLVHFADLALYRAKKDGHNKVCLAS